jgi:hypothetical protein
VANARIHIDRPAEGYADRLRAYQVVLDGTKVRSIKRGQTCTIETQPGRHELHLKLDWTRSRSVTLDIGPEQEAHLRCRPNASPLLALYWITLGSQRYIHVEVLEMSDAAPQSDASS